MVGLTAEQSNEIMSYLKSGEDIPLDYKNILFPPEKAEYELVYSNKAREVDILAETMAVPLQPIREFNAGKEDTWRNVLIFGDNLQAMKSLLQMKDEGRLQNPDGSYGVKLVFIDPPFGTGDEYGPSNGEVSYSAKVRGAQFIEFLRKRLVFLRELMTDNGNIFVRLDYHFGHYIKVIMDEVFSESNFQNEIVINRVHRRLRGLRRFNVSTESLFFYSKTSSNYFSNPETPRKCNYCGKKKKAKWEDLTSPGLRNPPERVILGKEYLPRRGRHFTYTQERIDELKALNRLRINNEVNYFDLEGNKIAGRPEYLQTDLVPLDNNWTDIQGYAFSNNYPTENHEELLSRILETGSREGDIVLDAFAGSGTTLAVAEKMKRKWIGIDSGKLSVYTIQRRLLNLRSGVGNKGRKIKASPFVLYNAGLYDFSNLKRLPWKDWRFFALQLFQCKDDPHKISGITIDGFRGVDDVIVFDHMQDGGVVLDYGYIDDLHAEIGSKLGSQFFIIAPAASVNFLEDYIEKGKTRYYVLRIPYSIINELHTKDFTAIKQPINEANVNETVDAVGFDFIRLPEVEFEYGAEKKKGEMFDTAVINIKTFKSKAFMKGATRKKNRETLSMVMVDFDYGGEVFALDNYYFAAQIEKDKWKVRFPIESMGKQIMVVYIDIFGNEFKEVLEKSDFVEKPVF